MSERGQSSTATRPAGGEPAAPHPPKKALILGIILTCQLMVVLDVTIVNIALPRVEQDLHFSTAGGAWVLNGYTLAFGGLLLMAGRAGDAFGRRRILLTGIALFTVASLVGGIAPTAGVLIAARVAQGIGAALTAPSVLALLASNFSEGTERNKALGTFSMVLGLGLTLGFVLGGALASASWRWVFFVNVPFGVIAVVLILLYLRETDRHEARFDTLGALLSTAGMVALVYALIHAASDGWSNGITVGGLVLGVLLLAAFVAVERGAGAPIMPLRLVTERNRAAAYLNNLLLPAATTGMLFLLSQYMQQVHGYGPLRTGVAFLPQAAAQFIAARTAPKLVAKLGAKRLTLLGTTLVLIAAVWLSQVGADSAYPAHLLAPLVLLGAGLGMSFMPLTMTVLAGLPPAESGAASGLLQAMQQMGVSLGVAVLITVFGGVVRGRAGDGGQRAVQAHGFAVAFGTAAVLAATALLVAAIVIQTRKPAAAKA